MKQFIGHFQPGVTEALNDGATLANALAGSSIELDLAAADGRNARPIQQAGTLSLLSVTVTANTLSGSATWKTGIGADGGTNGNCSVTFTTTQTGTLEDDSNTDDVAASDLYTFIATAASGSGSITFQKAGIVWEPDSGSISLLGCNLASSLGIANNGTVYVTPTGARAASTTEAFEQQLITSAGTWRYLGVGVSTITLASGTFTFTSRINGVSGNQVLALTFEDQLGTFVDESNTDTLASGDLINIEAVTADSPGSGAGGTNFEWFHSQINHTSDETLLLVNGTRETLANDTTSYFAISGQTNSSATESNTQQNIRFDATASHMGGFASQTGGGDMVLTLRINGAAGNQTATIDVSAGSPDVAIDDSNTDAVTASDDIAIEATVPASPSGNCRLQSTSIRLSAVAPSGTSLTAEQGSYTITGQTAALLRAKILPANQGSYTLTGLAANTSVGSNATLTAETGDFDVTGLAATFLRTHNLVGVTRTYTLTGLPAGLSEGAASLTAEQGSYTVSGQAATFLRTWVMPAGVGSFVITGNDVAFPAGLSLAAEQASYTMTGLAAATRRGALLSGEAGSYVFTGLAATFESPTWQNIPSNPTEVWFEA